MRLRSNRLASMVLGASILLMSGPASGQVLMPGIPGVDGYVHTAHLHDGRLYVGGVFSRVGESSGGWVAFDPVTGQPQVRKPHVAGTVFAACPDGAGGWYLAGELFGADGEARSNALHVLADGSLAPWAPSVNGRVHALALGDGKVVLAGAFTSVGGQPRQHLAAVDAVTGQVLPWIADSDLEVGSVAISGGNAYVGGAFTEISGVPRRMLAMISLQDGSVLPWDAGLPGAFAVTRMAVDRGRLLVAGALRNHAGQARSFMAFDAVSGASISDGVPTHTIAWDMVVAGGRVYLSGNEFPLPPRMNYGALALDRSTLQVVDWAPEPHDPLTGSGLPGSATSYSIGAWGGKVFLGFTSSNGMEFSVTPVDTLTGSVSPALTGLLGANSGPSEIMADGGRLWVAAGFRVPQGEPRENFAEIDLRSRTVTDWAPQVPSFPHSLVTIGSTLYLGYSNRYYGIPEVMGEAYDLQTHSKLAWAPDSMQRITRLHEQSGRIFASGSLPIPGPSTRYWVGELDPVTGHRTDWDPRVNGQVLSMVSDSSMLFIVGVFDSVGGQRRPGWAAFRLPDLTLIQDLPTMPFGVQAIGLSPEHIVLAGGTGANSNQVAAIDRATRTRSNWNPLQDRAGVGARRVSYAYGKFLFADYYDAGARLHCMYQQSPLASVSEEFPFQLGDPEISIEPHDGLLVLGGFFTHAGASPASSLAILSWPSTDVTPEPARVSRRITASPDPARTQVAFQIPDAAVERIEVLDLAGRVLWSARWRSTGQPTATWDLRTRRGVRTSPGVHFARFLADGRVVGSTRFVVIR